MSSTDTIIRFARPEAEQPTYAPLDTVHRSTAKTFTSQQPTRLEKRRRRIRTFTEDPFRARFGQKLPAAMRAEARGMDWKTFVNTYAPSSIRVESMIATRKSLGRRQFNIAMTGLRSDGRGTQISIIAMGVGSAMSEILADHGYPVEMTEFHQIDVFEATATFLYTSYKSKRVWAVGFGSNRDLSLANALCNAAARLHG